MQAVIVESVADVLALPVRTALRAADGALVEWDGDESMWGVDGEPRSVRSVLPARVLDMPD